MSKSLLIACLLGTTLAQAQDRSTPLQAGDTVPDVTLRTETDKPVRLRELVSQKPSVLIFYRGGWCPFCNRHLHSLAGIEAELAKAGAQLLAISADQPAKLRETPQRDKLGYRLFSDSTAEAARGFRIAFQVDNDTLAKYRTYGIDLEAASGQTHHLLPHPAVFVVDVDGKILFAHVNPDYRVRLEPREILRQVKAVAR